MTDEIDNELPWVVRYAPWLFGVFIVILFVVIFRGAYNIETAKGEIKEKCPKTELVVFVRGGIPRYIYDCTGIELKESKK